MQILKKCIAKNILLPSNDRKDIDFDLLLIQQHRRINLDIRNLTVELRTFNNDRSNKLSGEERKYLYQLRRKKKKKYMAKIDWLLQKQKDRRNIPQSNIVYNTKQRKVNRNKKDRRRFDLRKKFKKQNNIIEQCKSLILNKSDIILTIDDMELLSFGLKFVPTPDWNEQVEGKEWDSHYQHVRRVEWQDYFKTDSDNNEERKPSINSKKLTHPKFSRPDNNQLSEETNTYVERTTNKLRNLKFLVKKNHKLNNNLSQNLRSSLQKIKNLTRNKKIVLCQSDKDGKIIL